METMKLMSLTGALLLLSLTAIAQVHDLSKSNSGYLLTHTDSIYGSITLDLSSNMLLIKSSEGLTNFAAKEIIKVVFIDQTGDLRTFVTGFWASHPNAYFFEAIVTGETPLLYREGLKFDNYDEEDFPPYFTKIESSIYSLGSKKEIMNLLDASGNYDDFIKANKLKIRQTKDLILLFRHVNGVNPLHLSAIAEEDQ